jgi:3-keto-L-gulonate-6-phosphate decarboxylase
MISITIQGNQIDTYYYNGTEKDRKLDEIRIKWVCYHKSKDPNIFEVDFQLIKQIEKLLTVSK